MSRNALNLNFNKLQYEDFTSCIFTFIYLIKLFAEVVRQCIIVCVLLFAWIMRAGEKKEGWSLNTEECMPWGKDKEPAEFIEWK